MVGVSAMSEGFFIDSAEDFSKPEVFRFAIVAATYNKELVDGLLDYTRQALLQAGQEAPDVVRVPGAHEVPFVAERLAASGRYDAVIALALVIAGETNHHEVLALSTAQALQMHAVSTGVPLINGILCVNTLQQAQARAIGALNRGREFALSAITMAQVSQKIARKLSIV